MMIMWTSSRSEHTSTLTFWLSYSFPTKEPTMAPNSNLFKEMLEKAQAATKEAVSLFVVKGKRQAEAVNRGIHDKPTNITFDHVGDDLDISKVVNEQLDYCGDLSIDEADDSEKKSTAVINWLVRLVKTIIEKVSLHGKMIQFNKNETELKADLEEVTELKSKLEKLEKHCDDIQQRTKKGNLIISSPEYGQKKSLLVPNSTMVTGTLANEDPTKLCIRLIKLKTGVDLPETDVSACHILKAQGSNSSFIVRVHNLKPNSAWDELTTGLRTGKHKGECFSEDNIFINYQLTKSRGELLKKVREARRVKDIHKYSTDQNGRISIQTKLRGLWTPVSSFSDLQQCISRGKQQQEQPGGQFRRQQEHQQQRR